MADVDIIANDVPANIRRALVRAAKAEGVSVNEIAVRALADAYGVERQPKNGRFVAPSSTARMLFTVPDELRQQLRLRAAVNGVTMRGLVLKALAERFGLPFDSAERRPRTKR
jgi:predicted HicB family RNase H-like nuclease